MKKLMAIILTFAMVMSLCVVPASAAGSGVAITITPDKATVDTTTGDAVVTYTVKAKVTDPNLKVGALTITLAPDAGLTLAEKTKKADPAFYYDKNTKLIYLEGVFDDGIFTNFDYAKDTKTFVAAGATSTRNLNNSTGEVVLMTIMGKIAQGTTGTVTLGTTVHTYGDTMAEASHNCDVTPATVTILKAPITSVSAKVADPVKGVALATTGTVDSGAAYNITKVEWFEGSEATGTAVTGSAKPEQVYTAQLTVEAKAGENFTEALNGTKTSDGYSITRENETKLYLTKTFTATANKDNPTCTVPTGLTATYGNTLADVTLTNPAGNTAGTWDWKDATQPVGDVSATPKKFKATFTPTDTDTYATVSDIDVDVTVTPKALTDVAVADISDQEATGSAIKPAVTVTGDGGKTLVKDQDYTVSYGANTAIGTATATVKAKTDGNYTFTDVPKNFKIVAKAGNISISGDLDKTYDGNQVDTIKLTVDKNGSTGIVTYKFYTNATCTAGETATPPSDAGTYWAKAFMAADSNFGSAESNALKFTIAKASITPTVTLAGWTYKESAKTPAVTGNTGSGVETYKYKVKDAADSTYDATAPSNAGTYTVKAEIAESKNYLGGEVTADFTIAPKALEVSMIASVADAKYTGSVITPKPTVTDGSALVEDTDFTYAYENNKVVGTATVKIIGKGNYKGTASKNFAINKADAKSLASKEINVKHSNVTEQVVSVAGLMPADAGTPSYTKGTATVDTAVIASWDVATDGKVTFTLAAGAVAGKTETLPVIIKSDNYADSTVNVIVKTTAKEVPTVTAQDITVTYTGTAVPNSAINGTATVGSTTIAGTWEFQAGEAVTNVAESGNKTVVFKPKEAANYAEATTTIKVTINKAKPTGEPAYTKITEENKTLADAAIAVGTITPTGGTLKWIADDGTTELADTTVVEKNKGYNWIYTPADKANYDVLKGKVTPYYVAPSSGGGGYIPSTTPTAKPSTEPVQAGKATTSDLAADTTSKGNETSTTVSQAAADKIVDAAVKNRSEEIVISTKVKNEAAASGVKAAKLILPTTALQTIAEKTDAKLTLQTDVGQITLDNKTIAAVAAQSGSGTVSMSISKVKDAAKEVRFELQITGADGKQVSDFNGGKATIVVAVPQALSGKKIGCVYIDANAHYHKVPGKLNTDGSYTFTTEHFSSYAIMEAAAIEESIAAQKAAVKELKLKLTSKLVKSKKGKKQISLRWKNTSTMQLDGVQIYRSTKRNSGYSKKVMLTSKSSKYTDTAVKQGKKYYYKARGYVTIDGERVYTAASTKAYRTVK